MKQLETVSHDYPLHDLPRIIRNATKDAAVPSEHLIVAALRRFAEILVAAFALVLASPLMLAVAIILRRDSPGPAIFRQIRVGRNGRLFTFYKFRTHLKNAREMYSELWRYEYTPEELEELAVKRSDDPRVTRAGRWLRKSTLDELPNFWNLLKGDIALVGPRPDVPEMLRNYSLDQMIKFSVKPGITGLAQVCGRGRLKFQEMNRYDVEYVRNRSVLLDYKIILRTIKLVIIQDATF